MCPSLIQIGRRRLKKTLHKQTDKQIDWPDDVIRRRERSFNKITGNWVTELSTFFMLQEQM